MAGRKPVAVEPETIEAIKRAAYYGMPAAECKRILSYHKVHAPHYVIAGVYKTITDRYDPYEDSNS